MKLHYWKLFVGSVALAIVILLVGVFLIAHVFESKEMSIREQLEANISTVDMYLSLATASIDSALNQKCPVGSEKHLRDATAQIGKAQEMLSGFSDRISKLAIGEPGRPPSAFILGIAALLSTLVGVIGTLSSIILSWRKDMRDVRTEVQAFQHDSSRIIIPSKK